MRAATRDVGDRWEAIHPPWVGILIASIGKLAACAQKQLIQAQWVRDAQGPNKQGSAVG